MNEKLQTLLMEIGTRKKYHELSINALSPVSIFEARCGENKKELKFLQEVESVIKNYYQREKDLLAKIDELGLKLICQSETDSKPDSVSGSFRPSNFRLKQIADAGADLLMGNSNDHLSDFKNIRVKVENIETGEVVKDFDCGVDQRKADKLESGLLQKTNLDEYHVYQSINK